MRTYFLCGKNKNSNGYYKKVKMFKIEVIDYTTKLLGTAVDDFENFIAENKIEEIRSKEEYIFELLTMGVLWNNYIKNSVNLSRMGEKILLKLYAMRKNKRVKKIADRMRGFVAAFALNNTSDKKTTIGLENLRKLNSWMKAAGEFNEECKRLDSWVKYLETRENGAVISIIEKCLTAGNWFTARGLEQLGEFTVDVDRFIEENKNRYFGREDMIFCMRHENEYHLNMVGAQIMNEAFMDKYKNTDRKIVLLPHCMAAKSYEKCMGIKKGTYIECTGCTAECNVNKIRIAALDNKFDVYAIPHSSNFTRTLEVWRDQNHTGVVGVACILNLLTGGYEMKGLNIPGQCVLLDYSGCKKHWDKEGKPTEINIEKLIETISYN